MYFYDLEDYTSVYGCSTLPSNWDTFGKYLHNIHLNYSDNFIDWYNSKKDVINSFDDKCISNITDKYNLWVTIKNSTTTRINVLIEALKVATTYGCDFDNTIYLDYVKNNEDKISLGNEITLLITTGCNLVASNNDLSVDTSNVTKNSKTEKCTGVYIKQINYGSEFRGSVNIYKKTLYN